MMAGPRPPRINPSSAEADSFAPATTKMASRFVV
jgi:hypothetical protein